MLSFVDTGVKKDKSLCLHRTDSVVREDTMSKINNNYNMRYGLRKNKRGKKVSTGGLNRMIKGVLTAKVMFEQRPKGNETLNHVPYVRESV